MKEDEKTVAEVSEYLNLQIQSAIANFSEEWTHEEKGLILFMTILKHSDSYWREY
jgi:hypothetical protein